jgi:integrase
VASIERARSKRGGYVVRYRGPDRKPRTKTFRRKVDADQFAKTVDVDVYRGDWIDPNAGRIVLRDFGARWWDSTVDLRPKTRLRDEGLYRNHVLPSFGDYPLSGIDHLAVREWVAALSASGLAPATVHKCHQVLAKIMRAAVDSELIRTAPTDRVPLPRIEREEMRFLEPAEIARLAAAIGDTYRPLVLFGAYSGLRAGEMFALRRSRLDLLRGRADVVETLVDVNGRQHFGPPKTRASRRTVPLPRFVVDALTEHTAGFEPDDLVFTAPEGGAIRNTLFRRRVWVPACVTAGLGQLTKDKDGREHYRGLRLHDLRHTAVSLWIAAGASPKEIASRAGHTSVAVVLDRYGHLLAGSEDRVNDALDALARAVDVRPEISQRLSLVRADGVA